MELERPQICLDLRILAQAPARIRMGARALDEEASRLDLGAGALALGAGFREGFCLTTKGAEAVQRLAPAFWDGDGIGRDFLKPAQKVHNRLQVEEAIDVFDEPPVSNLYESQPDCRCVVPVPCRYG